MSDDPSPCNGDVHRSHRYDDDISWLVLAGIVLIVVGGIGTWFMRWDTGLVGTYSTASDRSFAIPGGCNADVRIGVWEYGDRVEVRLELREPPGDEDCEDSHCVVLDRPLGGRIVVDEPTGDTAIPRPGLEFGCREDVSVSG